jgi:myo-inositol-1(or 4)-monophosphatase
MTSLKFNSKILIFIFIKKAQIGVIYDPIRDELYSAVKNQGAFLNGRTLLSSGQKNLNKSQIITEFGSSRSPDDLDKKGRNMRKLIERVHRLVDV